MDHSLHPDRRTALPHDSPIENRMSKNQLLFIILRFTQLNPVLCKRHLNQTPYGFAPVTNQAIHYLWNRLKLRSSYRHMVTADFDLVYRGSLGSG